MSDWRCCSLRELYVRAEQRQLEQWDHTASVCAVVHDLTCVVYNLSLSLAGSKKAPLKPKPATAFHPLRKEGSNTEKMKLTPENFHVLKQIFVKHRRK